MLSIYPYIYSPMKFVGPYGSPTNLSIVHITLLVEGSARQQRFNSTVLFDFTGWFDSTAFI